MKKINNIKLKKEIRKLKKENETLRAYKEEMLNKSIIQEKEYYILPRKLFEELWNCYTYRPTVIIVNGKEAIQYAGSIYYLKGEDK